MESTGDNFAKTAVASCADVEIVVVTPLYRHSVFVVDAVESACAQETGPEFRVVIVDDGCPNEESRRACMALAAAFPNRVDYVRTRSGGLSAARNVGVDYGLGRWPNVRAFYFLDADNMIEPKALDRAWNVLMSDPSIDWAYPDITTFGASNEYYDYSGPYSAIRHLWCNVSEAGSMVRREVFDCGLRFSEDMRFGYEDWEFWWQCLEAGFVGRHVPFLGLRYRTRAESMVTETRRNQTEVLADMRRRHRALFRGKSLLAMQAAEAPRYALFDGESVRLCSDVDDAGETVAVEEFAARCVAASRDPYMHFSPGLLVGVSPQALMRLRGARLDRYALWQLERRTLPDQPTQAAAVEIVSDGAGGVRLCEPPPGYWPARTQGVHLMAIGARSLNAGIERGGFDWLDSMRSARPGLKTRALRVEIPETPDAAQACPDVVGSTLDLCRRLACAATEGRPPAAPVVRPRSIISLAEAAEVPRRLLDCAPLLSTPNDGGRDVALVTARAPTARALDEAAALATAFRTRGWRSHLMLAASDAVESGLAIAALDNILFCPGRPDHQEALAGATPYATRRIIAWEFDAASLAGLLLPMDAVVNLGCCALHPHVARLRTGGVAVAAFLEKSAPGAADRERDEAAEALGYEHVYDLIAMASPETFDWLHAFGAPEDKLVLIGPAPEAGVRAGGFSGLIERLEAVVGSQRRVAGGGRR